jgi:hypothetical protein
MGPILGVALLAAATGTASAAPNRTANLWACLATLPTTGVEEHVNWSGYHPDTLVVVAWQSDSSDVATFPTTRSVSWKFGGSIWETDYATWAGQGVTFGSGTMVAVDLYGHGKFLAETNAVDYGTLTSC